MLLRVGRIGKPHGLNGEVKVVPETEDPSRLADVGSLFVGSSAVDNSEMAVDGVRFQPFKSGVTIVLDFRGVDTRQSAEALRGKYVYARETDLPALQEGQWYLDDLVGMSVVHLDLSVIGQVRDVLDLPAHAVLVVGRGKQSDAMIPMVPQFIEKVDTTGRIVVVRVIEGLLE